MFTIPLINFTCCCVPYFSDEIGHMCGANLILPIEGIYSGQIHFSLNHFPATQGHCVLNISSWQTMPNFMFYIYDINQGVPCNHSDLTIYARLGPNTGKSVARCIL